MNNPYTVALISIGSVLLVWLWWNIFSKRSRSPLPPGPKRKWVVGNLFDFPTRTPWLVYAKWSKQLGPIVCLRFFGINIVVLHTLEAVNALFEQKGNLFSNRPKLTMIGELVGTDRSLPLLQYGTPWREQRKLMHFAMGPDAIRKYIPYQEDIAVLYLQALLEKPKDFVSELHLASIRIVVMMSYGFPVRSVEDEYVSNAERFMKFAQHAVTPGAYLVDFIPPLKYMPNLFGLVPFQNDAAKYRRLYEKMIASPFEEVKRRMAEGTALPSFTSDLLSREDRDEETIKSAASTMYAAGEETTFMTILTFILAMAIFPEKQKKAQEEIDRVVGSGRFPDLHDRDNLPYVDALIKEVMRWEPVAPFALPHYSTEDYQYKGYYIPAQSLVFPNAWAISHDEAFHDSPDEFMPERFLDDYKGKTPHDPHLYFWGHGRRICPGRYLAKNSIYIFVTAILSSFDILKPLDAGGQEVPLSATFTGSTLNHPAKFECRFMPRSAQVSERIKNGGKTVYGDLRI